MSDVEIIHGDCREVMRGMAAGSVDAIVTSPPYWGGVRDYGTEMQIGLEREPCDYAAVLTGVFREARLALRATGTLWLNLGDVFAASGKGGGGSAGGRGSWASVRDRKGFRMPPPGYKMKDLTLAPFLVAESLRADGWYLRQVIVWRKPNAAEPARADRPSLSHEYLFLFAAAETYDVSDPGEPWWRQSVWDIPPESSRHHPATMPRELCRRCVVASTRPGELVLDPFAGSGTTPYVCLKHGRRCIAVEIAPAYIPVIRRRVAAAETPLFDSFLA